MPEDLVLAISFITSLFYSIFVIYSLSLCITVSAASPMSCLYRQTKLVNKFTTRSIICQNFLLIYVILFARINGNT